MKINIRKLLGMAPLAAVSALVFPVASVQAVPAFDGWTATSGTISAACPTGMTCTPLVNGAGFLQQSVTDPNGGGAGVGVTFIQTIITDTGATGTPGAAAGGAGVLAPLAYSDENFVRQDQQSGILSQQRILETTAPTTTAGGKKFLGTASLATGWAHGLTGVGADLEVTQTLWDAGLLPSPLPTTGSTSNGDEFKNTFTLKVVKDTAGLNQVGKSMSIRQDVALNTNNATDIQSFVVEQRSGSLLAAPAVTGGLTLKSATPATPGGAVGGTVNWVAGNDVMVTWLGQVVDTTTPATGGSSTGAVSKFGFESVQNLTPGSLASATTFSRNEAGVTGGTATNPFKWDTAFGTTAPTVSALPLVAP